MNARGSTEVIVATIGLSMGVLNQDLFTAIVAMAVVTTLSMPPMLRWALARVGMSPEEAARLKREEFESQGFVSNIERLLVAVDASPSGQFASRLVGLLAGVRRIPTTVLHLNYASTDLDSPPEGAHQAAETKRLVAQSAKAADHAAIEARRDPVEIINRVQNPHKEAIGDESNKGYGLRFIGREPASEGTLFHEQIGRSALAFAGPFSIGIAGGVDRLAVSGTRFDILVPVIGTPVSRSGAELAIALAQASRGPVTALHVAQPRRRSWGRRIGGAIAPLGSADAILREIVRLGDAYGVNVRGVTRTTAPPVDCILRQLQTGGHSLLVVGVSPRPGEELFFGEVAAELLERAECSLLFVAGEPFTAPPAENETHGADAVAHAVSG